MACNLIGIRMISIGTNLRAVDDSFQFQVIGDCSGINSLMAITLMTAVFAHLTQDRLWKKLLLFWRVRAGGHHRQFCPADGDHDHGQVLRPGTWRAAGSMRRRPTSSRFPFAFGALCAVNKLLNWNQPMFSNAPVRRTSASAGARAPGKPLPLDVAAPVVPGKALSYDY